MTKRRSAAAVEARASGADRSAKNAARINQATATSQEIGPLPKVKNPARRARCKNNLKTACTTYFKAACHMGLAPYQVEMVEAFQDVILRGGKKARAVRRGGLKSTLARIAAAWAVLNGHRKFVVLVGATDDKSNEQRDNFFKMLATSKPLLADFPEIIPLLMKWRNPKKQLRLGGEVLQCMQKDDRGCILFPSIPNAELSEARIAPYSIMATDVSGLSFVDDSGKTIRPDLLIFDDVQTPQSAKSFLQTDAREIAVTNTFMGLAGLGETIAAIMVCTAREANDLTARFCDRSRHPDWDGQRFPVLIKGPGSTDQKLDKQIKDLWSTYGQKLRGGATPREGFKAATAYYRANKKVMDTGGKPAWERDKEEGYISSLQWCMTIKIIDPDFFRCELQQEGSPPAQGAVQLVATELIKRLSQLERGCVPSTASYLTAFIDSSDEVLWWMLCAWQRDFSGWVIDYGTWPDQGRKQFYKSHLQATISQQSPQVGWEEAFIVAHNSLEQQLFARKLKDENGTDREIDFLLKDWSDGQHKPRLEAQIRASPRKAIIRASKGFAPKPGKKPVHLWGDAQKDRHTFSNWLERRTESPKHVQFDANQWKAFTAQRLKTVVGAPSSLLLPGGDAQQLTLLAEHFTAEIAKPIVWDGTPGTVYEETPGRDNDWWDCLVGNAVAASMLGCKLASETVKPQLPPKRTGPIKAKYY